MSSSSLAVTATPKTLLIAAAAMLLLSVVFGTLNHNKVTALVADATSAKEARLVIEQKQATDEKEMKAREAAVIEAKAKIAENETKVAKAETDLVDLQKQKAEMETKLQENETHVATLQKQLEEVTGAKPGEPNPGAASPAEMQAQLDEARHLLESAEHEKAFLTEKLAAAEDRTSRFREERKARDTAGGRMGVRGTVLAVNQVYNFVVLNLGGRQGVEANSEMLVLRSGTLIGRIRISSVEPSTAIGDIVSGSLERGVQVQPGDTVIYAGTNS